MFDMLWKYSCTGCPANEENDQGVTPQKHAKQEGHKDAMKELKKLTAFQDKLSRGATPKGAADPWAIQVGRQVWRKVLGGGEVGGVETRGGLKACSFSSSPCGLMDKALVS